MQRVKGWSPFNLRMECRHAQGGAPHDLLLPGWSAASYRQRALQRLMGPTYYEVLGIDPEATREDVRRAYRARARATHPDQNPNAPQSLFVLIQQAYEVLSDPAERARYDARLAAPERMPPPPPPPPPSPASPAPSDSAHTPPVREHEDAPSPAQPPRQNSVVDRNRRPLEALTAGGIGLLIMVAFAVVPATREAFGWVLPVQLVGIAIASWQAWRGRQIWAYGVGALHIAYVAMLVAVDSLSTSGETGVIAAETIAVGVVVFAAHRLRHQDLRSGGWRRKPTASSGRINYGQPGYTWRRLGCFGWIVCVALGAIVSVVPAGLLSRLIIEVGSLTIEAASVVRVVLSWASAIGCVWALAWAYRRITRRPAHWCQNCGVVTDPTYRVCRACGRVKNPTS